MDGGATLDVVVLLDQDRGAMPNIFHPELSCPRSPAVRVSGLPADLLLLDTAADFDN